MSYRDERTVIPIEAVYGLLLESVAQFVVRSEAQPATDVVIGSSAVVCVCYTVVL